MRTLWALVLVGGILSILGSAEPAAPPACVPLCDVPSTTNAFLPPVVVVASGGTVTWSATDGIPHTATALPGLCFHAAYSKTSPGQATFRVENGAVYAKTPDKPEKACANAEPLPGNAFRIHYECLYHPNMIGELIVRG